ncbi:MAG: hypothetical protein H0X12_06070 [Nocardioides sp.]|nr:hypothetical protein [Nocardioides sp.]
MKQTEVTTQVDVSRAASGRRVRLAMAVTAVLVAVALGLGFAMGGNPWAGKAPDPKQTSARLSLAPAGTTSGSCLPFSVDVLADMPTAFSGTVVRTDSTTVVLEVDRWYRGGDADLVQLEAPDGGVTSLDGTLDFAEGARYLVTAAQDDVVNSCGFSSTWSRDLATQYDEAFGK